MDVLAVRMTQKEKDAARKQADAAGLDVPSYLAQMVLKADRIELGVDLVEVGTEVVEDLR